MSNIYIQLGSNKGDRQNQLDRASELIAKEIGSVLKRSSVYETEAWGPVKQQHFLNQVIEIDSPLEAKTLLTALLSIEQEMGRERNIHWGPRSIDLDLLFYQDQIIHEEPFLILPHPRISQRRFVLIPLAEIAEEFIHPIFKRSIKQLLSLCEDEGEVWKI